MRLADFERTGDGDFPLFVTRVPDAGGAEEYEFRIAGRGRLVEEMLAAATIELTIDSTKKKPLESPQFDSVQEEEYRRAMWELAGLEDIDQLLKPNPPPPERESSVFASIRSMSGDGTSYQIDVFDVAMPAGSSLLFVGTWSEARAFVTPASGDQDLFLAVSNPLGVVTASRLPGTATDRVFFFTGSVWMVLVWIRFFGFTAGVMKRGSIQAGNFW
jgi:hypothetical protein